MEFNKNQAAILAGSANVGAPGPSAGEIDLYTELIAFADLLPEEQQRFLARPKESIEEAVEPSYSDSVSAQSTTNSVEIEATALQAKTISASADSMAGGKVSELSSKASEGFIPNGSPALLSLAGAQSPSGSEGSATNGTTGDLSQPGYDRSRTGPLLAGLNVIPEFVFAGDLSLGVCLACGAESGADDLFCVSCGVFIDEIGSTPRSSPACGECGQRVTTDEIFCPWCGAPPAG